MHMLVTFYPDRRITSSRMIRAGMQLFHAAQQEYVCTAVSGLAVLECNAFCILRYQHKARIIATTYNSGIVTRAQLPVIRFSRKCNTI